MDNLLKTAKNLYLEKGTIVISSKEEIYPINEDEITKLAICCNNVDKEYIEIGDAGEKNNLLVGRFMTDIKKPEIVKNQYSEDVINILNNKKLINFSKKILDTNKDLFLRRVQFNQIDKGCFVGYHLDIDSNPDYLVAGVIQLASNYDGGLYRVYQKDNSYFDYKTSFGDLILSNCKYPHEVTKVENGERKSLVFFLSYHDKENRRYE